MALHIFGKLQENGRKASGEWKKLQRVKKRTEADKKQTHQSILPKYGAALQSIKKHLRKNLRQRKKGGGSLRKGRKNIEIRVLKDVE